MPRTDLVVIDPAIRAPALSAYNTILKCWAELHVCPDFSFRRITLITPTLQSNQQSDKKEYLWDLGSNDIGALFSLGSFANVTENLPWFEHCRKIQNRVIAEEIPFFGICFSHQLMAANCGGEVDFLKKRHEVPSGKFHEFRSLTVHHPKMKLLTTRFESSDYFSGNSLDLSFCDAIKSTLNWTKNEWDHFQKGHHLTAPEHRLQSFLEISACPVVISEARHEQEVYCPGVLDIAASSPDCEVEAMVHAKAPLFTIQTHPETEHPSGDGHRLIKNFLYMAHLYNTFKK